MYITITFKMITDNYNAELEINLVDIHCKQFNTQASMNHLEITKG